MGETRSFTIDGQEGFIVRQAKELVAYRNACPHIGMNLEFAPNKFLDADGKFIQCSMHGALFEIHNGECIHGPCLGDRLEPLEIEIDGDEIFFIP